MILLMRFILSQDFLFFLLVTFILVTLAVDRDLERLLHAIGLDFFVRHDVHGISASTEIASASHKLFEQHLVIEFIIIIALLPFLSAVKDSEGA
jgi:hypothetical protein